MRAAGFECGQSFLKGVPVRVPRAGVFEALVGRIRSTLYGAIAEVIAARTLWFPTPSCL